MAGLPAPVAKAIRQPGGASTWFRPSPRFTSRREVRQASMTAIVSPAGRRGSWPMTSVVSAMLPRARLSGRALGLTRADTSRFSASTWAPWPEK
jgi:hypothetical protein